MCMMMILLDVVHNERWTYLCHQLLLVIWVSSKNHIGASSNDEWYWCLDSFLLLISSSIDISALMRCEPYQILRLVIWYFPNIDIVDFNWFLSHQILVGVTLLILSIPWLLCLLIFLLFSMPSKTILMTSQYWLFSILRTL